MTCYCKKCRESRERWRIDNRDHINAKRRELRLRKKAERTEGHCRLCEIRLKGNNHGTKVYCRDCVDRFPVEVGRNRCKTYAQNVRKSKYHSLDKQQ